MDGEARILLLIGISVVAGVLLGAALVRRGWFRAYGAFLAAHVLAALGFYFAAQQGRDMQGLGHMVMLMVFVLPAMLGMVLGGAALWWRKRRLAR